MIPRPSAIFSFAFPFRSAATFLIFARVFSPESGARNSVATAPAIAPVLLSGCHRSVLYKGILPAADCSGIEYSLRLDPGSGEYSLETTYLDADGPGKNVRLTSAGRFEIIGGASDSVEYYRLNPKEDTDTLYFRRVDGNTLRLVNSELQEPSIPDSYDITRVSRPCRMQ